MSRKPFGLLELGSNSLKFYRVEARPDGRYHIETHKVPWRISHTFFSLGELTDEMTEEVVSTCEKVKGLAPDILLDTMLTVATGVFRELSPLEPMKERLKRELGLRLRVISGRDEAKLMARDFETKDPGSILLCDVGGATTEWALIEGGKPRSGGSVRLGAIRNHYGVGAGKSEPESYLKRLADYCDERISMLPVTSKSSLLAIGGTAKALARICEKDTVSLEETQRCIERVRDEGGPEYLKPSRREVLLPGLVILERLMARCQTDEVTYGRMSVRDGMAARLVKLLDTHKPDDLHSTLLLYEDTTKRFPPGID